MKQAPLPFQQKILDDVRAALRAKHRRILVNSPTGSGKTTMMTVLCESAAAKNNSVWVFVHRHELLSQAANRLTLQGLRVGQVGDGKDTDPDAAIQVVSIPTLASRLRRGVWTRSPPFAAFMDETHHVAAATWSAVMAWLGDAFVVGMTATPWQPNGDPLPFFTHLVQGPWPHELVGAGLPLCDVRIWSGPTPSLEKVAKRMGEFVPSEITAAYKGLDGDIVGTWMVRAQHQRTICFATSKDHSKRLVEEWCRRGFKAEHLDDSTPSELRKAALERLRTGATQILSNVALFTEGFDLPAIECAVLAHATQSEAKFLQTIGRALRAFAGKPFATVLDHGRNAQRFGHPLAARPVTLNEKRLTTRKSEEDLASGDGEGLRVCVACLALVKQAEICAVCGARMAPLRLPKINKVTLTEWMKGEVAGTASVDHAMLKKRMFWEQLKRSALAKKRPIWGAIHAYKAAFGKPPLDDGVIDSIDKPAYYAMLKMHRKGTR